MDLEEFGNAKSFIDSSSKVERRDLSGSGDFGV